MIPRSWGWENGVLRPELSYQHMAKRSQLKCSLKTAGCKMECDLFPLMLFLLSLFYMGGGWGGRESADWKKARPGGMHL